MNKGKELEEKLKISNKF